MKHKGFVNVFVLVVASIAAAGVSNLFTEWALEPMDEPPFEHTIDEKVSNEKANPRPNPSTKTSSSGPSDISNAHNAFGFSTVKILTNETSDGNVFISPTSIALALSMAYNGADEETKTAMQNTLQLQNIDITTVNEQSLGLITSLQDPDAGVALSIANSLWVRENERINLNQRFLDIVANYYNAKATTLDFSNPAASDTINAWVSENTNDKIRSIVPKEIPDSIVMYLINAVYFKGSWTNEFDETLTKNKDFTASNGAVKSHPLMELREHLPYLETEDFQSVQLPYGENERLSMYVFLPQDLDAFVQSLDTQKWDDWMKQYESIKGTVLLPRFKMEYESELLSLLSALGMKIAFSDAANFTNIGEDIKLSSVRHKTFIEVNEEGTEAAAVTAVGGSFVTSVPPEPKTFYMEVNRPFFLAIRDNETEEVLFVGAIRNP